MTFTDWKSRLLSLETIDWSKKNAPAKVSYSAAARRWPSSGGWRYERGFLEREERLGGVVPARIQANVPGCTRIGAPRPIHESGAKLRRQLREPLAGLTDFTVSLDELRRPDV
jgi:hypothetical protein